MNNSLSIINRDGFTFPTVDQAKTANLDSKGLRTNTGKIALYLTYGLIVSLAEKRISTIDALTVFEAANVNEVLSALSGNENIPTLVDMYGAMVSWGKNGFVMATPSKLKKLIKECVSTNVKVREPKTPKLTEKKSASQKWFEDLREMTAEEKAKQAKRLEAQAKALQAKIDALNASSIPATV